MPVTQEMKEMLKEVGAGGGVEDEGKSGMNIAVGM